MTNRTSELFQPIQTAIGILDGRDAIFLDRVHYDIYPLKLTLIGSLNGTLSSAGQSGIFYDYCLTFFDIQALQTVELDLALPPEGHSSFDQVLNSRWLSRLQLADERNVVPQTIVARCNHYRLWTYDYVFDVICSRYELTVQADHPGTPQADGAGVH